MHRALLVALVCAACGAVPDSGAGEACRSVFSAWVAAADRCGLEPSMPNVDTVCQYAYSYNDDALNGDCLPWIRDVPCAELQNAGFQAHCGRALYLRTW